MMLLAFLAMEAVAWATHKYVMHGFLWSLHRSHHRGRAGWFEMNDLFGVFFAAISVFLIYKGYPHFDNRFWLGLGIAMYGFAYFLVHDVLVHRRLKILDFVTGPYITAIRRAHKVHHSRTGKEEGEEFGFLLVHPKYFKKNRLKQENKDA